MLTMVSAKDLGTGKEQKITITASTKLSDEEIQQKVKDAERFAEEDKVKKESIEVRNNGDSIVYQTEKTLKEVEDKINADEKAKVDEKLESLKKALEGDDIEDIKQKTEELTNEFHTISQKLYENAQATDSEGPDASQEEDVVDADYEVVDED